MSKKLIQQTWIIKNKREEDCKVSFILNDENEVVTKMEYKEYSTSQSLIFDAVETKALRAIFEDTKYIFTSQNLK